MREAPSVKPINKKLPACQLKFLVNTAESLERRLSDGRIGPRTACRLIDEACQRVRRHCAKYLEYADTRNFLFAAEHVKRDYGWRPPRQPRKPVIDTQQYLF